MNHKVVVLEGPDGSGKTTLADALVKLGYRYVHCGPPEPGEDLFKKYSSILRQAVRLRRPTVIDRLYLGETIYGPVMRGADRLGLNNKLQLRRYCQKNKVLELVCLPPYGVAVHNWFKKRATDYTKKTTQYAIIWSCYSQAIADGYILYDYTQDEPIDKFLAGRK